MPDFKIRNRTFSSILNLAASVVLWPGLVLSLVLQQASPYFYSPNRDSGSFLYIARSLLSGATLYKDVWDNKPPGIFYLDALGLWLGRDTRWGVVLLELLFLSLAFWLAFKTLKDLYRPMAALVGVFVGMWGLNQVLRTGNFVEEFPLLFNFLAIYLFSRSISIQKTFLYDLLIGATAAFSFLFRANLIDVQITIGLTWILWAVFHREFGWVIKRLAWMMVGGVVVLALVGGYFWGLNTLNAALEASIYYNFFYTQNQGDYFHSIQSAFGYLNGPAWISLAAYIQVVVQSIRASRTRSLTVFEYFLLLLWPVEIGFTCFSTRAFYHYFIAWTPGLCIYSAHFISTLGQFPKISRVLAQLNRAYLPIFVILSLVIIVPNYQDILWYGRFAVRSLIFSKTTPEKQDLITAYLLKNSRPQDTVLAWGGQSVINYNAHLASPTAFIWYPIFSASPITDRLGAGFYQELTAHPPDWVIDATYSSTGNVLSLDPLKRQSQLDSGAPDLLKTNQIPYIQDVFRFFSAHYEFADEVDRFDIYRLIPTAPVQK